MFLPKFRYQITTIRKSDSTNSSECFFFSEINRIVSDCSGFTDNTRSYTKITRMQVVRKKVMNFGKKKIHDYGTFRPVYRSFMRPISISLHGIGERGVSQAVALQAHAGGGRLRGILSACKKSIIGTTMHRDRSVTCDRHPISSTCDMSRLNVHGRCFFLKFYYKQSLTLVNGLSCPPLSSKTPSGDTGKIRENIVFQKYARRAIGPVNRFRLCGAWVAEA